MDQAIIRWHVAEAEARIAQAESRIARQREIVAECSARGRSTEKAEQRLADLTKAQKTTLHVMQQLLSELGDRHD